MSKEIKMITAHEADALREALVEREVVAVEPYAGDGKMRLILRDKSGKEIKATIGESFGASAIWLTEKHV